MAARRLYFIAVMPPEKIRKEVTGLKMIFSEKYEAKHALKSPPHLTLIPPFKWQEDREEELLNSLNVFTNDLHPFELELKDFSAFPPRVIYINIIENKKLNKIYRKIVDHVDPEIREQIRNIDRFNPHMTLATRDLTKENFRKAWANFKDEIFSSTFMVDRITLLKHNGKYWDICSESFFGNN